MDKDIFFDSQLFTAQFELFQQEVHENAVKKGWWEKERNDGELLMLIVSELSEGLEALRNNNAISDKIPEFLGIEEELADAVIRIADMAEAKNLRLAEAIIAKMKYNEGRSYKHGGKTF